MDDKEQQQLWTTVRTWRKGDAIPTTLLNFPRPHQHDDMCCGLMIMGDYVDDYLHRHPNADLLEALILDPRTSDDTLRAALRASLAQIGLGFVCRVLGIAKGATSHIHTRVGVPELMAKLRQPCLRLQIARFDKDRPIPLDQARATVDAMQESLQLGRSWHYAYEVASTIMRMDPNGPGTHLNYAYVGSATEHYQNLFGIDLRKHEYAPIPDGHLEIVFSAQGGTHVIETDRAIWLYHVMEYHPGRNLRVALSKT